MAHVWRGTLAKVPALSSSTPLYLCMKNENILLILQFYLPQGHAVQIALQSPSDLKEAKSSRISWEYKTFCLLLFSLLFSHILHFLSPIFTSCFWPMLLLCFHKAVIFSCPCLLIFFISNKQDFARPVQTVTKTILAFTQELREFSASYPSFFWRNILNEMYRLRYVLFRVFLRWWNTLQWLLLVSIPCSTSN